MIVDELREELTCASRSQQVNDVRIGLGYTGLMVEEGGVGVAYTFRDRAGKGCSVFAGARPLAGSSSTELLAYLGSDEPLEATVGLATANALLNRASPGQREGDILEHLPILPEDHVGMVGYFGPLVGPLQSRVEELVIFERDVARSDSTMPAAAAPDYLRRCDVAIITATALILGEMDGLLEAASTCREIAVVGASTPLIPDVFGRRGVTLLSGVVVVDGPGILQVVSEGGGMGMFGRRIRKVSVRIKP